MALRVRQKSPLRLALVHGWLLSGGEALNLHFANVHFVFRSGVFPFWGFELEGSLVATSLEGFSVTSHKNLKRVPRAPFQGIKLARGAPPGTKN